MASKQIVTSEDIRQAHLRGQTAILVEPGAIVTQQAKEDAAHVGVQLQANHSVWSAPQQSGSSVYAASAHGVVQQAAGQNFACNPVPVYAHVPQMGSTFLAHVRQMLPEQGAVAQAVLPAMVTPPVVPEQAVLEQPVVQQQAGGALPSVAAWLAQGPVALQEIARTVEPQASTVVATQLHELGVAFQKLAAAMTTASDKTFDGIGGMTQSSAHLQQRVFSMQQIQNNPQATASDGLQLPFTVQPAGGAAQTAPTSACGCQTSGAGMNLVSDDLFGEVRRRVLQELPQAGGLDPQRVDELIRKAMSEKGPGCGGGCRHCAKTQAAPAPEDGWLARAGSVVRVNSRALTFGQPGADNVGMMQVLGGKNDPANVGYIQIENGQYPWTFEQPEVLVVLEGELTITVNNQSITAAAGDVCAIDANTQVVFGAHGRAKYTTVSWNANRG